MKTKTYIFGMAYYTDGTHKTSRIFTSPDAFSRWANNQFRKDEGVTVYEYQFSEHDIEPKLACTWHA